MTNFKLLQKLFFLLVMGFSLSFICSCGDDEEDEPVQNPNEEETYPTDSIPSEVKPIEPNDSVVSGGTIVINGHEAVDLGLSVKWATCNVGASSPEEYGGYYAWGETVEKEDYSWNSYKWSNGSSTSMNKYCAYSSYGKIDDKTVLELEDDVANAKWGDSWRMPTREEMSDLLTKCTWEWTTYNGVEGRLVTGPNGNSIFLPYTGYRKGKYREDDVCYYWTASLSLYENTCDTAFAFDFEDDYKGWENTSRFYGYPIRPVTD